MNDNRKEFLKRRLKAIGNLEKEFIRHYGVGLEMAVRKMSEFHEDLYDYIRLKQEEESGRLVKLPCVVGDTVWVITAPMNISNDVEDAGKPKGIYQCRLVAYSINISGIRLHCEYNGMTIHAHLTNNSIGKDVFLTREAAEAKLKEMEGMKC